MKDIRTNTTQIYKFANHSYKIGNDLSLLHVPERSQDECVLYRCCVWPPVGHRILESDYSLPKGNDSYSTFTLWKYKYVIVFFFMHWISLHFFVGCQNNAVFSSKLQGAHVTLSNQGQYVIIAGVLLLVITVLLIVAAAVCLCKRRKTHTIVPLSISIWGYIFFYIFLMKFSCNGFRLFELCTTWLCKIIKRSVTPGTVNVMEFNII